MWKFLLSTVVLILVFVSPVAAKEDGGLNGYFWFSPDDACESSLGDYPSFEASDYPYVCFQIGNSSQKPAYLITVNGLGVKGCNTIAPHLGCRSYYNLRVRDFSCGANVPTFKASAKYGDNEVSTLYYRLDFRVTGGCNGPVYRTFVPGISS
jgi:hypothetical protein